MSTHENEHPQAPLVGGDHFQAVVSALREGVMVRNAGGQVISCNSAAVRLLGLNLSPWIESLGLPRGWTRCRADGTEVPLADTSTSRVLAGGAAEVDVVESFHTDQGRFLQLQVSTIPVADPITGSLGFVVSSFIDVTKRQAAEVAAARHCEKLEAGIDERSNQLRLVNDSLETAVRIMTTDIASRKQAEQGLKQLNDDLLRARDEAESATRAKSAFLANTSHEIRTPLNAILGLTFLMSRDSRDAHQIDRLSKVSTAAQHLLEVINDILDLSKIEAGKLTLDNTEFSVEDLLTRSTEMVTGRARDKGLEVIVDTDHLPLFLKGDKTRLSQVLINLLANAVKFTEHGWVRLRGETIAEEPTRVLVRFEVQDTGPGIPKAEQAALFNAFSQVDNSASRHHGGTGLGLALTRQMATVMGGEAGLVSAPGSGSAFWFTAWLGKSTKDSLVRPWSVKTRLRVLLVDDLAEARDVIGERLRMMGLDVDAVGSGPEAISRVEASMAFSRPYQLLLIDWKMQPMDGLETLSRVRALMGEKTPPSVLVTASDDDVVLEHANRSKFSATLLKPVTASGLQDVIASVLRGHKVETPFAHLDVPQAEALLRRRHTGQRVLLAEDNPINREVAQELLGAVGLIVESAIDGAEAIEMALSRPYDIVFMDVQMPSVDGLDATRAIRAKGLTGLPIVAMTANAFVEDRAACMAAGMNDHVAKPVMPALLYDMVLRWLPLANTSPMPLQAPRPVLLTAVPGQALVNRLKTIDGFDIAVALRQAGGEANLLARVLSRFVVTYKDGLPDLINMAGSPVDRLVRWGAVCHSVRGALGVVGASDAAAQVLVLEQLMRDGASLDHLATAGEALHAKVLKFVGELNFMLPEPSGR